MVSCISIISILSIFFFHVLGFSLIHAALFLSLYVMSNIACSKQAIDNINTTYIQLKENT